MKLKSQNPSSVLTEYTMETYLLLWDAYTGIHSDQNFFVTSVLPESSIQEFLHFTFFVLLLHILFSALKWIYIL